MQVWTVISGRHDSRIGQLSGPLFSARCALGAGGVTVEDLKREGDSSTPAGVFPLRQIFYRPDKGSAPVTRLDNQALSPDDGWCDDPENRFYNQHITLPFGASHENLWREDDIYDLILVIGHNDNPPTAGLGSAIFMHVAKSGYSPTKGCIALALNDLQNFLKLVAPGDMLRIE